MVQWWCYQTLLALFLANVSIELALVVGYTDRIDGFQCVPTGIHKSHHDRIVTWSFGRTIAIGQHTQCVTHWIVRAVTRKSLAIRTQLVVGTRYKLHCNVVHTVLGVRRATTVGDLSVPKVDHERKGVYRFVGRPDIHDIFWCVCRWNVINDG
jgi:hypothetical protein